jgi:hypothetical protein
MMVSKIQTILTSNRLRNAITPLIALALLLSISFATNYPSFSAWFLPIDDHEYVRYLGTNSLDIWQVPYQLFRTTEVGSFGHSSRFRPIYYLIRLLLISTIGGHPGTAFFFRAAIQAVVAFMAFAACRNVFQKASSSVLERRLRDTWSLIIAIGVVGSFSWIEISTRLGPAELELAFGVGLTVLALTKLITITGTTNRFPNNYFAAMLLGVVIASGSKENGTITLIPLAYILFKERRILRQSAFKVVMILIALITPLLVLSNTVIDNLRNGASYEDRKFTIPQIWDLLYSHAQTPYFLIILICTVLTYLLWSVTKTISDKAGLVLVAFFFLLNISESFFYGDNAGPIRYKLLSDYSFVLVLGITFFQLFNYFCRQNKIRPVGAITAFLVLVFAVLVINSPIQNLINQNKQSENTFASSSTWRKSIAELSNLAAQNNTTPILIHEFDSAIDGEMTVSLIRFLKYKGMTNTIFLQIHERQNNWDEALRNLTSYSIYGNLDLGISPLSQLSKAAKSICISFGTNLDNPNLPNVESINDGCAFIWTF